MFSAKGRGKFSCVELGFVFKRILAFYALEIYIPATLIVMVSFMALFIDYKILPARYGIEYNVELVKSYFKHNTQIIK